MLILSLAVLNVNYHTRLFFFADFSFADLNESFEWHKFFFLLQKNGKRICEWIYWFDFSNVFVFVCGFMFFVIELIWFWVSYKLKLKILVVCMSHLNYETLKTQYLPKFSCIEIICLLFVVVKHNILLRCFWSYTEEKWLVFWY